MERRWTVLGNNKRIKNHWYVLCECQCKKRKYIRESSLFKDSFGCKSCNSGMKTHGLTKHPIYHHWSAMKQRILYKKSVSYKNYGARGIKICDEWLNDFESFMTWAINNGYRKGLSLDRIDNDGPYSPENCKWATRKQQSRNTRRNVWVEINGKKMILKDWAKKLDVNYDAVRGQIYKGLSPQEALLKPGLGKFRILEVKI